MSLSRLFQLIETGQSVGGAKTGEPQEKPPGTPASRTWLVSHVARAGLEPTPDTAVAQSIRLPINTLHFVLYHVMLHLSEL